MKIMDTININIDLGQISNWIQIVGARFSHLSGTDLIMMIIAVVAPPLAVFIKVGLTAHFWINVVLTILGVVPGQIHALWVVLF